MVEGPLQREHLVELTGKEELPLGEGVVLSLRPRGRLPWPIGACCTQWASLSWSLGEKKAWSRGEE